MFDLIIHGSKLFQLKLNKISTILPEYKTDYARVNEFGQCEEPTEEMLAEREQEMADTAAEDADVPSPTNPTEQSANATLRNRRGARDKRD